MPRIKSSDSPIGEVITNRLEEMERPQTWLARKVNRSQVTIASVVKGRLKPSKELIDSIAMILSIDSTVLIEALDKEVKDDEWTLDNCKRGG